jgi:DNA-binding transcriptional ArsR family regulator
MENHAAALDTAFHALADPTRRSVLRRLLAGPAPVKTLAEPFPMGLPAFLKHLKVLEDSGLIRTSKQGRVRTCRLEPARLEDVASWLAEQLAVWEGRSDRLASDVERNLSEENDT